MAITTQYGNEVILTDREGEGVMTFGEIVYGVRTADNQRRSYRAGMDLRAPGGIAEIAAIVETLPRTPEGGRA